MLNKDLLPDATHMLYELILGHAISLKICWQDTDDLLLLNIYASHTQSDQPAFWTCLQEAWDATDLSICSDFMLSDFNVIEDSINHTPSHHDRTSSVDALTTFCTAHNLQDTWHHTFPDKKVFTYCAHNSELYSMSYIDRIYTAPCHTSGKWEFYIAQ
ncbi:hypothetical protein EWM64_g9291 [Hericium alpestre]|uniref:Endonuclease/exonuclease/phosphatase domain-containing protein n=1 Tax=Hericium alpestre TaxID=135208 RepID=A0A4Y9ZLM8_9AGAM|nr:hypothetical protein EWM64_g9291 [Hericium alpestre]